MKARKIAAAALVAGGVPLVAAPTWAHAGSGDKVTLCHRTDANNNPYVQITVDPDAVFKQGHDGHDGPVWNPSLKAQHTKWGDIIPPFDYTIKHGNKTTAGHYPGKNWTADGQAVDANGCQVAPPTSPSPTPSSSTSPTPSSSLTSSPSASATSTPTSTATSTATSTPTSTTSTSSSPSPTASTTVLPTSSTKPPTIPTEVPTTPPTAQPQPLPFTGSDTLPLVALGVGMVGAGTLLAARARKH